MIIMVLQYAKSLTLPHIKIKNYLQHGGNNPTLPIKGPFQQKFVQGTVISVGKKSQPGSKTFVPFYCTIECPLVLCVHCVQNFYFLFCPESMLIPQKCERLICSTLNVYLSIYLCCIITFVAHSTIFNSNYNINYRWQ